MKAYNKTTLGMLFIGVLIYERRPVSWKREIQYTHWTTLVRTSIIVRKSCRGAGAIVYLLGEA